MFYLFIDTTLESSLVLYLIDKAGSILKEVRKNVSRNESEVLIGAVFDILKDVEKSSIQGIIVVKGPKGRFSAIRSGIAFANALGYAWNIPVLGTRNDKPKDFKKLIKLLLGNQKSKGFVKHIVPVYEKDPV